MGDGMSAAIDLNNEPDVVECRRRIDRALGGLNTLHVGPLDDNIATTIDDLLAAIDLLERLEKEHRS
jgi:hypothetical protein